MYRYHLHKIGGRFCVFDDDHGLAQSVRHQRGAVSQFRDNVLSESVGTGAPECDPSHLQQRSKGAVYESGVYRTSHRGGSGDQYGWTGAVFDKIFIERLWRSVKDDKVYLSDWQSVHEEQAGLDKSLAFYNHERPHRSLHKKTPFEVYCNGL